MSKRKNKKTNLTDKYLIYIAWFLAIVAISLSSLVAGYYLGYDEASSEIIENKRVAQQKSLTMLKDVKELKNDDYSINKRLKEVLRNDKKTITSSHEYDDTGLGIPPARVKREIKILSNKPKLAIIIDDMSVKSQVNAIKALNIPITMSFLPPSANRPNSAKLASKENFYMVHLPMEAQHFNKEEPFTLRVSDSLKTINNRVTKLKQLFPRVKYINNHTGSKFTSDEIAMNKLISVLKSKKINFIDSRTTAKTKAPKVMKNFGLKYVARDIFLDNRRDEEYIISQIKKAIKIAKRHGTAIAIGHPHRNTILALNDAKELFKDVELVYINRLR